MRHAFAFIDLFAGIGGMRLAAESAGGRCVMSSETDPAARRTYEANFGEAPRGDVRQIGAEDIPDHDLLLAGFPCQSFSICGRRRGFEDTRGTLFFEVARIIAARRPAAAILENVKFLTVHDGGRTLGRIMEVLKSDLGYHAEFRVLSATAFGLPQARERLVIVATRDAPFSFPQWTPDPKSMSGILRDEDAEYLDPHDYTLIDERLTKRNAKSGLVFCGYRNRNLRKAGTRPGTEHLSRVHKQPNRIYRSDGVHPTLAAGETSGRYWVLHEGRVRKLGLDACFRLQGFPESFVKPGSQGQLYKQIGNSVPVPMIEAAVREVMEQGHLGRHLARAAA